MYVWGGLIRAKLGMLRPDPSSFFCCLIALSALPLDKAEHLSLLRFLLLRVHFGCHKVDIPDDRAENREAEDDKEQCNDWSAVCFY